MVLPVGVSNDNYSGRFWWLNLHGVGRRQLMDFSEAGLNLWITLRVSPEARSAPSSLFFPSCPIYQSHMIVGLSWRIYLATQFPHRGTRADARRKIVQKGFEWLLEHSHPFGSIRCQPLCYHNQGIPMLSRTLKHVRARSRSGGGYGHENAVEAAPDRSHKSISPHPATVDASCMT